MPRSRENGIFALADKDVFEPVERYRPISQHFIDPLSDVLPSAWQMSRGTIWMHCSRQDIVPPRQGWKIHISGTMENALEVLLAAASILIREKTSFKFCADKRLLSMLCGKNWSRGGSGKFITIYPRDDDQFAFLLEQLTSELSMYKGPYILSDKRFRDSSVVHYRYGGIRPREIISHTGEKVSMLEAPDGTLFADQRQPYYIEPDWLTRPSILREVVSEDAGEEAKGLKEGRFEVLRALAHSNAGGVYVALDKHTLSEVVIKEARPHIVGSKGSDYQRLLEKEFRILAVLDGTETAPKPIDFFTDWEHVFLVQEYVQGVSLRDHSTLNSPALRTRIGADTCREFYVRYLRLFITIAKKLELVHALGISFGDLSPNNVLIDPDTDAVHLIDFEAACQTGIDDKTTMYTPGFGINTERVNGPSIEGDIYSFGALMLSYLFPLTALCERSPLLVVDLTAHMRRHIFLPERIASLISALMDRDFSLRPQLADAVRSMEDFLLDPRGLSATQTVGPTQAPSKYATLSHKIVADALQFADYKRIDRLFPADPRVFVTNGTNLAYGASGVAYSQLMTCGTIDEAVLDWIENASKPHMGAGLYSGLAGVAWLLASAGRQEGAENALRRSIKSDTLNQSSDLFNGLAGIGLASLELASLGINSDENIQSAISLAKTLKAKCISGDAGIYWLDAEEIPLGLGHGGAGVALFLARLACAANDSSWRALALEALAFDLSKGVETKDGGTAWPSHSGDTSGIIFPYRRIGSAGMGTAILEVQRCLCTDIFDKDLETIYIDTDRAYSVTPGRFIGLAGIGEFLLDLHEYTNRQEHFTSALRVAETLELFQLEHDDKIVFAGDSQQRLCFDLGTGAAGIALFLRRFQDKKSRSNLPL